MTVSAADFNTPFQALLDRTAYLNARQAALIPDVGVYTASSTWTKPTDVAVIDFVLVGGGGGGGGTSVARFGGGGGGGGGVISMCRVRADSVPSTLYVYPGAAGVAQGDTALAAANGGNSVVNSAASATVPGTFWLIAAGGQRGGVAAVGYTAGSGGGTIAAGDYAGSVFATDTQYRGGAGGAGQGSGTDGDDGVGASLDATGSVFAGSPSPYALVPAVGGSGATVDGTNGVGGPGGAGYGAGGGGAGGGNNGTNRGGGGGGGGPGFPSTTVGGIVGGASGFSGAGAVGLVMIVSWRSP